MTVVSREEAASALKEIGEAREKVALMHRYSDASPHLILWGSVWLLANAVCDFDPRQGGRAWVVLTLLGVAASAFIGYRTRAKYDDEAACRVGKRWGASVPVVFGYFVASMTVLPPLDPRQFNAWISLFFACAYMVTGIWAGWRISAVGLAVTALILFGYFGLPSHYFLWMGVVSGGALIGGGLWLRKV